MKKIKKTILVIAIILITSFLFACISTPPNGPPNGGTDNGPPNGSTNGSGNGSDTILVQNITIDGENHQVVVGGAFQLSATVLPENATNRAIEWESQGNHIATVNASGYVTGVSVGEIEIVARSFCSRSIYDTIVIEVTELWDNPFYTEIDPLISAQELVYSMQVGWNLGNAFDSHSNNVGLTPWVGGAAATGVWSNPYDNLTVAQMEGAWIGGINHVTSRELIRAIREAGFDTIRIPVSWFKATDGPPYWNIRQDWMERVYEVVGWAAAEGMFIILNTHHEERVLPLSTYPVDSNSSLFTRRHGIDFSINFIQRIWTQIAERFINYNEKLIFAGLNEPRTRAAPGIPSPNEWNGGTAEERANLNRLNQYFVDIVRATGGNNRYRILMAPTHAASASVAALNGFIVPYDPINTVNKIIMSVHSYTPFNWAHGEPQGNVTPTYPGSNDIMWSLNGIQTRANALNVPVILGEWGSVHGDLDIREARLPQRRQHAYDYVRLAAQRGMLTVVWDDAGLNNTGGFGLINRSIREFTAMGRVVVDGIMEGVVHRMGTS